MDSQFQPFSSPGNATLLNRTEEVDRVLATMQRSDRFQIVVLSGGLGMGKSTMLHELLPDRLKDLGYEPINITCSPGLDASSVLSEVATQLEISDHEVESRFGLDRNGPEQTMEQIEGSKQVLQQQIVSVIRNTQSRRLENSDIGSALVLFADAVGRNLVVFFDQVEALIAMDEIELHAFLFSLISAARGKIALVFAVREENVSSILSLASIFHELPSRIIKVSGIKRENALSLIELGCDAEGVRFSKSLIDRILSSSENLDGTFWPVAVHALCRGVVERVKAKRKTRASIRELKEMGDVDGAINALVLEILSVLPEVERADAFFVLSSLARYSSVGGPISSSDVESIVPSIPLQDIHRILNQLRSLRLIKVIASGRYALAHDIITRVSAKGDSHYAAVARGITEWSKGGREFNEISAAAAEELLKSENLSIVEAVYLVQYVFANLETLHFADIDKLRSHLRGRSVDSICRFITNKMVRSTVASLFRLEDVFVLLLDGRSGCLEFLFGELLRGAQVEASSKAHQLNIEFAINLAAPTVLGELLVSKYLSSITQFDLAFLVPLLNYLTREPGGIRGEDIERLLAIDDPLLLSRLLPLSRAVDVSVTGGAADGLIDSDIITLRAEALYSCIVADFSSKYIIAATNDASSIVRRRSVFAVAEQHNLATDFLRKSAQDPSPFVREAVMEVAGTKKICDLKEAVFAGLNDDYDFVRESAIYALKEIVPLEETASAVKPLLSDSSAYVREAASRVVGQAGVSLELAETLSHLSSQNPSLTSAVLQSIEGRSEREIFDALYLLLSDDQLPSEVAVLAIRAISEIDHEEAVTLIADHLRSPDIDLVQAAIVALQKSKGDSSTGWLSTLVMHSSADIRERVVYALADKGGEASISALKHAVWDSSPAVVARAIYALARLNVSDASTAIEMVSDDTDEVKIAKRYYMETVLG